MRLPFACWLPHNRNLSETYFYTSSALFSSCFFVYTTLSDNSKYRTLKGKVKRREIKCCSMVRAHGTVAEVTSWTKHSVKGLSQDKCNLSSAPQAPNLGEAASVWTTKFPKWPHPWQDPAGPSHRRSLFLTHVSALQWPGCSEWKQWFSALLRSAAVVPSGRFRSASTFNWVDLKFQICCDHPSETGVVADELAAVVTVSGLEGSLWLWAPTTALASAHCLLRTLYDPTSL